jgi:hypothetical protein
MPIISLPSFVSEETEKYIVERMQSSARFASGADRFWLPSEAYAQRRDIGTEFGYEPSSPRRGYKYFTWSWDRNENAYVVLIWGEQDWKRLK